MSWKHLLIASDGTGPALHALAVATELSRDTTLRRTVVTVLRRGESPSPALAGHAPVILHGDPGIEIARAAEHHQADLIVMGRRAIRYGSEYRLGLTAESVIRRARVPCLFIPEAQRDFAHVVAALDGTERGWAVLDVAREVRCLMHGELELVTVEPGDPGTETSVPQGRTLRMAAQLETRQPRGEPVLPPLRVRRGEPVTVLRQELCHPGSDLLVVGSRRGPPAGHSTGVGRALLHSALSAIVTVPL